MEHANGQPNGATASQRDGITDNGRSRHDWALRVVHHKVTVKGSGGVTATIVVTVQRGQVWLSIQPPFTWEAIMAPGKVEELVQVLGLANEEARRMVSDASGSGERRHGNGRRHETAAAHVSTRPTGQATP